MKRQKNSLNIENFAGTLLHWGSLVLFGLLTVISLLYTRYFVSDYAVEIPYSRIDIFPICFLGAACITALFLFLEKLIITNSEKAEDRMRKLLLFTLFWTLGVSIVWIILAQSGVVADQQLIATSAQRFLNGNFGRLDYGKYLYVNPHQLGITAYAEVVFRLFGAESLLPFHVLNALAITASVYLGYKITRFLFDDLKIAVYYLFLAGLCFPLFGYSSYFYGDVISLMLALLAVWQLTLFLKEEKKIRLILLVISISFAVLLRNNSLIVLIACASILLVKALTKKRLLYLITVILMVTGAAGSRTGVEKLYERRSGIEINDGMPMILYIAMGMQEGDKEAGWYNGYSFYTYQDVCKFHGPTAAELGKAEIRARAKEFLKDPAYALDFYYRKFSSQWAEPTCGCFIMTYATEAERSELGKSLYTGTINKWLERFMDSYQLLIYGMVLVYLWLTRKEKPALENYILLIAIIGGVLFHMIWEAKSRYVLPYFVMMLPMAGAGLAQISGKLGKWRRKDETVETGR